MAFHTNPMRSLGAMILLLLTGPLTTGTESRTSNRGTSMPKLTFNINIKRDLVCLEERTLQVEVTLPNPGKSDLVIDPDAMVYQKLFVKKKKPRVDEITDEASMSVGDPVRVH
jgi:hypothetical protein